MLSLKNYFPKVTSLVTFPPECEKKKLRLEEEEKEGGGGGRQRTTAYGLGWRPAKRSV